MRVKLLCVNYSQHHGELSSISGLNGIDGGTVNGTVKLVFDIISQTPDITIDKLILETGKSRRTISRSLKQLKDNGLIVRSGSDKNGKWEIIKKV